ncbi:MAG TPA: hypothetical protein VKU94_04500 [Geobacterales bacterium]|nr:hypothetical protein [Geobacterales bacterium]
MVRCWNCGKDLSKVNRTWKYGIFDVKEYICSCNAVTREYLKNGKPSFYLGNIKGKGGFKKVNPK